VTDYTPDELLAIESDRRRRTVAAFRLGSAASAGRPGPTWITPLAAGLGLAIAVALTLGIVVLAQGAAHPSVTNSPVPAVTPAAR